METTIGMIGQRIKELRLERRLTLEEVAERSGCSAGFLSQLERNRAAPSISMLYSIARALGVSITHFFPEVLNPAKVVRAEERETFCFEGSPITYSLLDRQDLGSGIEQFLRAFHTSVAGGEEGPGGGMHADVGPFHAPPDFQGTSRRRLKLWR